MKRALVFIMLVLIAIWIWLARPLPTSVRTYTKDGCAFRVATSRTLNLLPVWQWGFAMDGGSIGCGWALPHRCSVTTTQTKLGIVMVTDCETTTYGADIQIGRSAGR